MGVVEGNRPASDNAWEAITTRGSGAIERWIDAQLYGKSCAVVLIGAGTAGRKWINYEIARAWEEGKGVFGIHVNGLKDLSGSQAQRGRNPFRSIQLVDGPNNILLSSIVNVYDPPYVTSKNVYAYIRDNMYDWIENAIDMRSDW
jgi:hypothetical protein